MCLLIRGIYLFCNKERYLWNVSKTTFPRAVKYGATKKGFIGGKFQVRNESVSPLRGIGEYFNVSLSP